ncbi:ABC transporter ATP-binding protein/permease [Chitinophaga sedimenti]|uniref:ABC transporter ATP-binding protein n=1 Tax=Chitinophaga sedimenti TaxID=2033606 RepID=UPI002006B7B8|nr:ABC transporter ATP-binding protein [Chitinophaga sedimenti]MCK7559007.1 ABC transporter ATP-binding protein/permease [Chitinophaga sedimenti]
MKVFRRLLLFAKPLHHFLPEYIIYTFFGIIFGMLNFTMLIPLLDTIFQTKEKAHVYPAAAPEFSITHLTDFLTGTFEYYYGRISHNGEQQLLALGFVCAVIVAASILANISRYLAIRVMGRLRMKILESMRNQVFARLSHQSLDFYHKRQKGQILSTLTNDAQEVENSVVNSIQVFLRDPFIIIGYFVVLFLISTKLTLFTIIFFPLSGMLIGYISKQLKNKSRYSQEMLGKILNVSEETVSGVRIIQGFTAETFMQHKLADINRMFSKISRSMFNQREAASPISEVLGIGVVVILVMYGGNLVLSGQGGSLTAAAFITYLALYSQILQPAKNISNAITTMQRGLVAAERIYEVLDAPITVTEKPNAETIKTFEQSIAYDNMSFSYNDETHVLKNINLNIEKGKMIALVGRSGAGKSTMVDLLPRFYDVTTGSIKIDGKDVRDLKMNDLRQLMGIVSQEAILFNETVFNNIAFGQPDANKDAVIQAAKIANAHEFIKDLENGYDTNIGDRGLKLSGGQRQRLTIARAVFKNPPILILDEATSALDTESEKLVQEALNNLMKNRTSIVIAHRLSTIQHADEIIVMEKGEIMERGKHEELLQRNGIYKKLVEMQEFK